MDNSIFTRGFKQVRKVMKDKAKYVADCKSCRFYYSDRKDGEYEICHNNEVTEFDIQESNGREFCVFWDCQEDK